MAGRGRGKGTKRRAEAAGHGKAAGKYLQNHHHSHKTISIHHQASQDYPFSPPSSLRGVVSPPYSKKHFGSHSNKTSTCSSTLRPTLIINLDKDDDATPELHHHTSHSQHGKEKEADKGSMELISEIPARPQEGMGSSSLEYIVVEGHRVKTEFGPLVRAIFEKYGDIMRGTDVKSPHRVSMFLEQLCHVYQRLERAKLGDLTHEELQGMMAELRHLERRKLRVGWILERVEDISKMKEDCQPEASSIGRMEKDLEAYERQVCLLQQKISSTKQELLMHNPKYDQIKEGGAHTHTHTHTHIKATLIARQN